MLSTVGSGRRRIGMLDRPGGNVPPVSDSSVAPSMPQDLLADRPGLFIACLCAEWCGSCREYRAVFDADRTVGRDAAGDVRAWIDIEDHADVLGDLEIETFPTLLIGDRAGRVYFYGSVTPHA